MWEKIVTPPYEAPRFVCCFRTTCAPDTTLTEALISQSDRILGVYTYWDIAFRRVFKLRQYAAEKRRKTSPPPVSWANLLVSVSVSLGMMDVTFLSNINLPTHPPSHLGNDWWTPTSRCLAPLYKSTCLASSECLKNQPEHWPGKEKWLRVK